MLLLDLVFYGVGLSISSGLSLIYFLDWMDMVDSVETPVCPKRVESTLMVSEVDPSPTS